LKLLEPAVSQRNMNSISRAQFLRGDWSGHNPELRPPWAQPEALFVEACDGCGDCVDVCPQEILNSERGLPLVDFTQGECTFCGDCESVCQTTALRRPAVSLATDEQSPWPYRAMISSHCLATRGTYCVRCIDSCPQQAITVRPALRSRLDIHINDTACNGCGACIAGCPASAIHMQF
jgi:ferredoxin-type protein NapF